MDRLIRGLLCDDAVSFFAIDGSEMVRQAMEVHGCSATCTAALGRALMGSALMGVMLKDSGVLTVTIKGGGEAGQIVCVANSAAKIKGYIANPFVELPPNAKGKLDVGGAVGRDGFMTVVRDMGLKEPYIGQSALVSGEIAEDFANYFLRSQGIATLVYLGVHFNRDFQVTAAAGIVIQPLPYCDDLIIDLLENRAGEIAGLTGRIEEGESLRGALESILGDMGVVISSEVEPAYECDCSRERLEGVLVSLGKDELEDMIHTDGGAELCCQFCNKKYNFSGDELTELLAFAQSKELE